MLVGSHSSEIVIGFPLMSSVPFLALIVLLSLPWAVILEHVDHVVEVNKGVVDGNNLQCANCRAEGSPGNQVPNKAKSLHTDLHHRIYGKRLALHEKIQFSLKEEGTESLIL